MKKQDQQENEGRGSGRSRNGVIWHIICSHIFSGCWRASRRWAAAAIGQTCFSFSTTPGPFTGTFQGNPPHQMTLLIQFGSRFWFVPQRFSTLKFVCMRARLLPLHVPIKEYGRVHVSVPSLQRLAAGSRAPRGPNAAPRFEKLAAASPWLGISSPLPFLCGN